MNSEQHRGRFGLSRAWAWLLLSASIGLVVALTVSPAAVPSASASTAPRCSHVFPTGSKVVAIATINNGKGYWLTNSYGDVAAFGDATCHGSLA